LKPGWIEITMNDKKYALIIIDMQNDFVLPEAPACVSGAFATIPSRHAETLTDEQAPGRRCSGPCRPD
jgi:nicotinamidase-related amidase